MAHSRWITTALKLEDARELALTLYEILRQQPTSLSDYADDGSLDYERLPDWFTGAGQGRELWNGGEK